MKSANLKATGNRERFLTSVRFGPFDDILPIVWFGGAPSDPVDLLILVYTTWFPVALARRSR